MVSSIGYAPLHRTYDPLATDWECYADNPDRIFNTSYTTSKGLTVEICSSLCENFTYFGVEYGNECYCDNTLPDHSLVTDKPVCNRTCTGNQSELCGGIWHIAIYSPLHTS